MGSSHWDPPHFHPFLHHDGDDDDYDDDDDDYDGGDADRFIMRFRLCFC